MELTPPNLTMGFAFKFIGEVLLVSGDLFIGLIMLAIGLGGIWSGILPAIAQYNDRNQGVNGCESV